MTFSYGIGPGDFGDNSDRASGGEERSGIKRFQLKVFWNVRRGKIVLGLIWMLEDGSRINFEWVKPFYQDLDGVQLETDFMMFTSWSKSW